MEKIATLDAQELVSAVTFASKVIHRRGRIPILGMVKLQFRSGELAVAATDLDFECRARVDCDATEDRCLIVYPREVVAAISHLSGPLTISRKEGEPDEDGYIRGELIHFSGKDSEFTISGDKMPEPEDWPAFVLQQSGATSHELKISEAELEEGLRLADKFASREETRYYLNGVHFDASKDGKLLLIATDGHRLMEYTTQSSRIPPLSYVSKTFVKLDGETSEEPAETEEKGVSIILPTSGASLIRSLLKKGGNREVSLWFYGNRWEICVEDRVVCGKLIDGTYPDWRRALPHEDKLKNLSVTLPPSALRTAGGFAGQRGGAKISPEAGTITVKSHDMDAKLVLKIGEGKGPDIGFNAKYLKELAMAFGEFTIAGHDSGSPVLISAGSTRLILMPMRV